MKFKGLIAAPSVAMLVTALAAVPAGLPAGWTRAGDAEACLTRIEAVAGAPTPKAFVIDCSKSTKGFATLMQTISAADYAGKRVRLTARVQGDQLTNWGGLWLRGDAGSKIGRVFDNMELRPLKGSFGWREATVVLQFPADVDTLAFGFLMDGMGLLRATDFRLEAVSDAVPLTQGPISGLPRQPQNLSPQ